MNYHVIKKEKFKIIGMRRVTPYGGGTWDIIKKEGTINFLSELRGASCNLGLCFGFDEKGNNDYMCGIEYKNRTPGGLDTYLCPTSSWLIFEANGTISNRTLANTWKRIYSEFLPQSNYVQSNH